MPTLQDLKDLMSNEFDTITSNTGQLTDSEINDLIKGAINVFDNLDPDRPVKVRNLNRA